MNAAPHSIGVDQPLETAHTMMRRYDIRHLPVLDSGSLVGILSSRDLYIVESMPGTDRRWTRVEEAMTQDTYCVHPDTPVEDVANAMAEHKYGCAVVMDGDRVCGIFTTTDALRALSRHHASVAHVLR